jgi:FMN phosphatase YigB (HAD superfamily)
MELPRLNVTDVLIDIDDTITFAKSKAAGGIGFLLTLADIVAEQESISHESALERIREVGNPETTCLFTFLPELNVSRERYWQALQEWLCESVGVYPDAEALIRALSAMGMPLYTATTNARMGALAKLATSGLATIDGSPFFTGYFGGDAFGDPMGKFTTTFFPSILKAAALNPATTLMVGDDPQHDLAAALAAGIEQVIVVRRDQEQPLVKEADGGLYVQSLELVIEMIG